MRLYDFFRERAATRKPLVLVTVFETRGSTYSKAGGQMLIDGEGNFCGMLSGGCLEGDLVERARTVIDSDTPQTATYDLSADDDLWGLGVGCDGTMRLLLQPLSPETDYQPFAAIAEILNGDKPAVAAIVIAANGIRLGAMALIRDGDVQGFGIDNDTANVFAGVREGAGDLENVEMPDGHCQVLFTSILPAPALLVLGAGLDSEPVVRFATELGWRCTVADHRPAYIQSRHYPGTTRTLCCDAAALSENVELSQYEMAIVMSHHLVSDRAYLEQLGRSSIGYIGLLGPAGRRERLLDELAEAADGLRGRLHGPAGIMLGGRGPAAIALEIVAGMQKHLAERD